MALPQKAFLVSHTHWDREWYQTFNRFRVNLVDMVGQVLDKLETDPAFNSFVLDGQSIVLEDYLEAVPEDRLRVSQLIASGKLAAGPWYILPDEYLVSGEATARNLLLGKRALQGLGSTQKVGYMPDSFGHPAQIPQILNLAGLDSFVFTRGLGDEAQELGWLFNWTGPDGSQVLAVNQCEGYCNAGGLGQAELWHAHTRRTIQPQLAVEKMGLLLEKMTARPGHDPALLNNGCDHFPPQRELGTLLDALQKAYPEAQFQHGRFEEFLAAVRENSADETRPSFSGELLGGKDHPILSGVWSARMYLKQENESCQNLLTRLVEPLSCAATLLGGDRWPAGLLNLAWKELLRNHPHDSICGCSTDAVHQDMETRFAAVRQTGEQILSRLMDRLSPRFGPDEADDLSPVITVANALPFVRSEVVERLVVLPNNEELALDKLNLVDDQGQAVPFRILDERYLERFWGIDYRAELFCEDQLDMLDVYLHRFGHRIIGKQSDGDSHDCFFIIQFLATDLPAVGHRQYRLIAEETAPTPVQLPCPPVTARKTGYEAELANEHLKVILHPDGTFDLNCLETGQVFTGQNLLEDTEDAGDEYDYCPAEGGMSVFSGGSQGKVKITDSSDLMVAAEAQFRFDLPRSLEPDRKSRHSKTTPCDVVVRLSLMANSRRLEIETTINNRAFDHRLRVWFPTGITTDQVHSDGHFMINQRPLRRTGGDDWVQPAPATWPQQDWSALSDQNRGLAIFNRGLPEFQTWHDDHCGTIYALTLLRSVDWLSRDDLSSRNNINAGPTLHTPGAQCIGRQTFKYAVMPFAGEVLTADLPGQSQQYRVPPVTGQGVAEGSRSGGESLLAKTEPRVDITAIKMGQQPGQLIVRLVNLSDEELTEVLHLGLPVLDAEKLSLLESPLEMDRPEPSVTHGGLQVAVPLEPFEIATLALELET